jgi:DNA-binding GntR family transcriptional regulator
MRVGEREKGSGLRSRALATILEAEIGQGRYELGSVLPSEAELRMRFGVGRHMVREAVSRLEQAGLVEKRQGAATRVVALQPKAAYVHSLRSLAQVIQFTRETQLEVTDRAMVAVQAADAELVRAAAGTRWLRLRGVRRNIVQNEIISYTTVFVHARFAPLLVDVREPSGPIYALIEARTGEIVDEAEQAISAGSLPAEAANVLGLAPGDTAIRVTRRYFDMSGGIMLASLNWHPPATFSYVISLRRDQAS